MTPLLFNLMMLALVALKVLVALVILNWIASEPKRLWLQPLIPRDEDVSFCIPVRNIPRKGEQNASCSTT